MHQGLKITSNEPFIERKNDKLSLLLSQFVATSSNTEGKLSRFVTRLHGAARSESDDTLAFVVLWLRSQLPWAVNAQEMCC